MKPLRLQPFLWNQMHQLQNEMNRLFDRWDDSGNQSGLTASAPAVNLWQQDDTVFVEVELPGLDAKSLEIHVTGENQLTLKGERKSSLPEKSTVHYLEREIGSFARVLSLPFPVDADKVEAHLENGVLLVKLPKHEAAKPRKISIKTD